MSHPLLEQVIRGEAPPLVPLTTEQYRRLTESGVLPEGSPIELIDGFLVYKDRADSRSSDPMNQGPDHANSVRKLMRIVMDRLSPTSHLTQCQLPIHIPPRHEPEPDLSIIEGPDSRYASHLPEPADTLAVFEVAHSSRSIDRSTKQRVYANAGIAVFVIVDLIDDTVQVFTAPSIGKGRYHRCDTHSRGETATIELRDGTQIELEVNAILP